MRLTWFSRVYFLLPEEGAIFFFFFFFFFFFLGCFFLNRYLIQFSKNNSFNPLGWRNWFQSHHSAG